jgi:hypothetical protein
VVKKNTVKTSTMRSPLTDGPSMTAEAKKYMDDEIDVLFF